MRLLIGQRLRPVSWVAAIAGLLSGMSAQAAVINDFSVIVGGNYSASSQVWEEVLVRGDVSGNATIGTQLTPPANYTDAATLGVGGQLLGGSFNIQAGSVYLSGTQGSASINLNGGPGTQIYQNDPTIFATADTAVSEMIAASEYFAGLTANSDTLVAGNVVTFNPVLNSDNIAVFEIDGALLSLMNAEYTLNIAGMPPDATYLFNVIGDITTAIPNGNVLPGNFFPTGFTDVSEYVMWNFNTQESDLLIQREWRGSVLVPYANLSNTGAINGGVYVGGDFNQSAEVRGAFAGFDPTEIPEPSSVALLGLIGLVFAARRARRRPVG